MQFTQENCEKVMSGAKTMTRRVVKPGEFGVKWDGVVVSVLPVMGRSKWDVGNTYAIQPGRGKKAVGRMIIGMLRRERLQDISGHDCYREGIRIDDGIDPKVIDLVNYSAARYVEAFRDLWDSLYGDDPVKGWKANPEVWVIAFKLFEPETA